MVEHKNQGQCRRGIDSHGSCGIVWEGIEEGDEPNAYRRGQQGGKQSL